jgi:hypothetical protein
LQQALDQLADGDVLLVASGVYDGVPDPVFPLFFHPAELVGKSLTIVADAGATAVVRHGLRVANLDDGGLVVLRGLTFSDEGFARLLVEGVEGALVVEDCDFAVSTNLTTQAPAAEVRDVAAAHFVRCQLRGTNKIKGSAGTAGLSAWSSNVSLYDCLVTGGFGGPFFSGAPGLQQTEGFVFVSGTRVRGGNAPFGCAGPGVALLGFAPELVTLEVEIAPGLSTVCAPAPPVALGSGTWTALPGVARSFEVSSPVREGEVALLSFAGAPGDFVWLALAPTAGFAFDPFVHAVFQLAPVGTLVVALAPLGPGGELSLAAVFGDLGPGVDAARIHLQSIHLSVSAELWLGGGSTLLVLDAAF